MSTKLSRSNVPVDADGFNTDIRWTFVRRGGKKSMLIQHQAFEDRYSGILNYGISQMGKKEERLRAEELKLEGFVQKFET